MLVSSSPYALECPVMRRTSSGRQNQKERTRRAIVSAAVTLIQAGRLPSISEVADEALVSPATAYRYFPDQLSLLGAALRDGSAGMGEGFQPGIPDSADPVERVDRATDAFLGRIVDREPLVRAVMALSLLRSVDGAMPREEAVAVRPGFRRAWIDEALRPAQGDIDPATLRLLKLALGVVMGPEALVALEDTLGVESAEAIDVCRWMARTLTSAALPSSSVQRRGPREEAESRGS
jgi:AcrR family transcriptional regulator